MTNNNTDLPQLHQPFRAGCAFVLRADGKVLGVTLETEVAIADPSYGAYSRPACTHPGSYTWGLPGGGCEGLEGPEDCARRELYEETGYVAGSMIPVHVAVNLSSSGKKVITSCYVAHVVAADAAAPRRAPGEGFAVWVDPGQLLDGPYHKFNAAVLAKLGLG